MVFLEGGVAQVPAMSTDDDGEPNFNR
jgi:hypothetical protein